MSLAHPLTAKQSKRARSLLKWNIQDVVSRSAIIKKRLEQFEHSQLTLMKSENDDLVKLYTKQGIAFHRSGEVSLSAPKQVTTTSQGSNVYEVEMPSYDARLVQGEDTPDEPAQENTASGT